MKTRNYTESQVLALVQDYKGANGFDAQQKIVNLYVDTFKKPKASIIAKLVKEGIYVSKSNYSPVTKGKPETKKHLVRKLERIWKLEEGQLNGLDVAPKSVILLILKIASNE